MGNRSLWVVYRVGGVCQCVWRKLHRFPQGFLNPVLSSFSWGAGVHRAWLLLWELAHVSVDLMLYGALTARASEYVGVT